MKNKFLLLAAFGTAALGSAIVSAPANAQIAQGQGPSSSITVNVTVPEVLYLRTITDIDLPDITPAELTTASLTAVTGSTPPAYKGPSDDKGETPPDSVNTASPFDGDFLTKFVTRNINNAYAVWSNSPTGKYNVDFTPNKLTGPGGATVDVAVQGGNIVDATAEGLLNTTAKNITLQLNATNGDNIPAGKYSGTIGIAVWRP